MISIHVDIYIPGLGGFVDHRSETWTVGDGMKAGELWNGLMLPGEHKDYRVRLNGQFCETTHWLMHGDVLEIQKMR